MPASRDVDTFTNLHPDLLLAAIDGTGVTTDGRLLALNSYENRVYQVGLQDGGFVVAKFYRPRRWSNEQILEEHAFTLELAAADLPAVAPVEREGVTLHQHAGFRFALYPRLGGRAPELDRPEHLKQIGRLIARLHNVGANGAFRSRPSVSIAEFGTDAVAYLLENDWIPDDLQIAYRTLTEDLLTAIQAVWSRVADVAQIRLQGDCHPGNLLWNTQGPWLLDFDDARTGPAIQDLWMFLSGDRDYAQARLAELLEGYRSFRDFDARELHLIEPLRTLRVIHYAAWLARRWDDPAFPRAFPWFNEQRYWEQHLLSLREQLALIQEPPLEIL
jgi:Ser/Thr protein kinase RdoA (MazF antagonist)